MTRILLTGRNHTWSAPTTSAQAEQAEGPWKHRRPFLLRFEGELTGLLIVAAFIAGLVFGGAA